MKKIFPKATNSSFLLLLTLSLITLARTNLMKLYAELIINPIFSTVDQGYLNDALIGILIVSGIRFIITHVKERLSFSQLVIFSYSICVYLSYRIPEKEWCFTRFETIGSLAYFDALMFLSVAYLIKVTHNHFHFIPKNSSVEPFFIEDRPLETNEKDLLGFENYATDIALRIRNSWFDQTFAIGINAPWGFGKTSFMQRVIAKLQEEKDKVIIMNFNAWSSMNSTLIYRDFFDTLQQAVRPTHLSLANWIIQYSDKLSKVNKNWITTLLQYWKLGESANSTSESLYKKIDELIYSTGRKIVIFLDDIDRLSKEEMLAVIRIIRNSANFRNTFFVVAYDRNYILSAIKDLNPSSYHFFLEKILQIEITLPFFEHWSIISRLKENLKSIEIAPEKDIDQTFDGFILTQETKRFRRWIANMRDVSRLSNSLALNFSRLESEVYFEDFFHLELLRFKFPSVYELIHRKKDVFLGTTTDSLGRHINILLREGEKTTMGNLPDKRANGKYLIEEYVERHEDDLAIPKQFQEDIIQLLKVLFEVGLSMDKRDPLSVIYPENFAKYFSYQLDADHISQVEFDQFRRKSIDDFQIKIDEWVETKPISELQRKFHSVDTFFSRNEFEILLEGIFHFANSPTTDQSGRKAVLGYSPSNLRWKIELGNYVINEFYNGNKEDYKSFIIALFKKNAGKLNYQSAFLGYLLQRILEEDFVLESSEMEEIALFHLEHYCEINDDFDMTIWQLFENCKSTQWVKSGGGYTAEKDVYPDQAKQVMRKFFLNKDSEGLFMSLVNRLWPKNTGTYMISEATLTIWESWDEFENDLKEVSNKDLKKEFLNLFYLCKEKNFSVRVPFVFKTINAAQYWST